MHRWIFWILLLLLPTQLGKHFWPDSALIFGIRVDYLSPTAYLTDIVVVALLVAWAIETGGIRWIRGIRRAVYLIPLFLLFLLFSSLFIAQNQEVAVYKLVKILEFFLLGAYVYHSRRFILGSRLWRLALSIVILYTSFLGILQILLGHSIGGIFWFSGERTFSLADPGVAKAVFAGQEFLRPYSTFSHPNSLAGFLLVVLILLFPARNILERLAFVFGTVVLFLSFSQTAWLVSILVLVFLLFQRPRKYSKWGKIILFVSVFASLFLGKIWSALSGNTIFPEEIFLRVELLSSAYKMFLDSPIFGVGLNNFINLLPLYGATPAVSWWLQPVHNIFVLWTVETGLVGLLFLLYFLWRIFRKIKTLPLVLVGIFLTGLFDHYWLTLQQNQLLLAIVLGALSRYTVSSKNA